MLQRIRDFLRHDPRADRTLVVARLSGRSWSVFHLQADDLLYEGPFIQAWARAIHHGRQQSEPSMVVAVNNEGEIIAREMVEPIGSGRFSARRQRAASGPRSPQQSS